MISWTFARCVCFLSPEDLAPIKAAILLKTNRARLEIVFGACNRPPISVFIWL